VLSVALVMLAAGCSSGASDDAEPPFDVSSAVVSHKMTQDISVWAPDAEGSWPIVFAYHGIGGDRSRWDVTGPALASQGVADTDGMWSRNACRPRWLVDGLFG
jgi:hypothetical protein